MAAKQQPEARQHRRRILGRARGRIGKPVVARLCLRAKRAQQPLTGEGQIMDRRVQRRVIGIEDLEPRRQGRHRLAEDREVMVILDPVMAVEPGQKRAEVMAEKPVEMIRRAAAGAQGGNPATDAPGQVAEMPVIGQPDLAAAGQARRPLPAVARMAPQKAQQTGRQTGAGSGPRRQRA